MEMVSYRVLTDIAQVWTGPDISVRSGDQNAFFENMPEIVNMVLLMDLGQSLQIGQHGTLRRYHQCGPL
jgi:hypothetical protein